MVDCDRKIKVDLRSCVSDWPGAMFHNSEKFQLADRLHSAAIHLLRRARKRDTESGEGPARLSALSVLVFGGPMTLGQLAQAEQVKPPTMTRIVTGLEESGLAERGADAEDARRIRMRATAKGKRLLQQARKRRIQDLARSLEKLTPEQLRQLQAGIDVIERIFPPHP